MRGLAQARSSATIEVLRMFPGVIIIVIGVSAQTLWYSRLSPRRRLALHKTSTHKMQKIADVQARVRIGLAEVDIDEGRISLIRVQISVGLCVGVRLHSWNAVMGLLDLSFGGHIRISFVIIVVGDMRTADLHREKNK